MSFLSLYHDKGASKVRFEGGWGSGGVMVLGKLPVLGRPTNLDYSRSRAYCAYSRCGWGLFGHFFLSSIIYFFFLPLSGGWCDGAG